MPKRKTKLSKSKVAVGYIRVSTAEQANSGLSLEAQRLSIEEHCKHEGLTLDTIYADKGVSGTIPITNRPGGKRMFGAITKAKGSIGAVVIHKLDRAFRDAGDCIVTVDDWRSFGVGLHIRDFGGSSVNTESATGRATLHIMAVIAEMGRNLIAERVTSALAVKKSRGEKIGPTPPYGFKVIGARTVARDNPKPGQSATVQRGGTLVPHKAEQDVMAQAAHLHRRGYSARRIATELWDQGIGNRIGKKFHHKTIGAMLGRVA